MLHSLYYLFGISSQAMAVSNNNRSVIVLSILTARKAKPRHCHKLDIVIHDCYKLIMSA